MTLQVFVLGVISIGFEQGACKYRRVRITFMSFMFLLPPTIILNIILAIAHHSTATKTDWYAVFIYYY